MACRGRETSVTLHTSNHRTGLKFKPYTYVPYVGLYSEDGQILRGTTSTVGRRPTPIPAPFVAVPSVCAGQLGI